jgi:Gpi18-like mannosyltransferase
MKTQKTWTLSISLLALALHMYYWPHPSTDWTWYYQKYLMMMKGRGMEALAGIYGNSSTPFTLLLFFISRLPVPQLIALKAVYFIFQGAAAWLGKKIVMQAGGSEARGLAAFAALLFMPAFILNSAVWGQNDCFYAFFLLLCFYVMLQKEKVLDFISNDNLVFLLYGTAFSFKLQSIFFAGMIVRYIALRKPKWTAFLWFFVPYAVFSLPLVLAGRPAESLLAIYPKQVMIYTKLSFQCVNLYQLFPDLPFEPTWKIGLAFAVLLFTFCSYYLVRWNPPFEPLRELRIAYLSCLLIVYFLPKMHDRYFYPAEIFLVLLTCLRLQYAPLLLIAGTASYLSYWPHLFQKHILPLPVLAGIMTAAVAASVFLMIPDLWKTRRR